MKPNHTFLLVAALFLVATGLHGQADTAVIQLRPDQVEEIRKHVSYLKTTYRDREMARNSPDRPLLSHIAVAAIFEPQFIEDVIDLTSIKYMSPDHMDMEPPPYMFSPAASELLMLGEVCRRPIENRLAGATLTQWQRKVLQNVMGMLDRGLNDTHSFVYSAKARREAVIAKMQKDGILGSWVALPTNPTPPPDDIPPMAPPAPAVSMPTASSRWPIWVAVLLVSAGVLWLLLKVRKRPL